MKNKYLQYNKINNVFVIANSSDNKFSLLTNTVREGLTPPYCRVPACGEIHSMKQNMSSRGAASHTAKLLKGGIKTC